MGLFHRRHQPLQQFHRKECDMASEAEQKGINVPQHKRIAMGEKLDGTSYQPKGGSNTSRTSKPAGGLSQTKRK